jgi:hypothetical protein
MRRRKTPISGATSYRKIGEFWDEHDLADYWDQTHEVEMTVSIDSSPERDGSPFCSRDIVKSGHDRSR